MLHVIRLIDYVLQMNCMMYSLDGWRWRSSGAAANQFLLLLLRGNRDAAGRYYRRLGWCQNRQIVRLFVHGSPRSGGHDQTLKVAIIAGV